MALDALVDSTLLDAACTYEAGKIREKLGSSAQIAYDLANGKGFGDAIAAIPSGGGPDPYEVVLNRNTTGDIDINVTNNLPESSTNIVTFNGLFRGVKISTLKVRGLWFVPSSFANQQLVGTNGSESVLTSVEMPDAVYPGQNAFRYAKALTTVKLYNMTTGVYNYQALTSDMFRNCTALQNVAFPKLDSISSYFLGECTSLIAADFGALVSLNANAFNGSSNMDTLIIRTSSVCALANINAFSNTKFASGKAGGTLYVPNALISSYQSATNWSTILGYANNQIKKIEGTIYETQYADGTPIT